MFTLNCKGRLLVLSEPVVMGIINVTPDSFYEGSRMMNDTAYLQLAEKMIGDGATILDVGGQSTRPGSQRLTIEQELIRVLPAIENIHRHFPETILSVDTYYANVAHHAVSAGASMVNDISAGSLDSQMFETVSLLHVPYICMHMLGTPDTMHQNPGYDNLVTDLLDFFIKKITELRSFGIHDIVIDPGFGFGKTIAHNLELLQKLIAFSIFEKPILAGLSRKSTIYKTLGVSPSEALNGTTVLNTIALLNGCDILRVHDVKEAIEVIRMVKVYEKASN